MSTTPKTGTVDRSPKPTILPPELFTPISRCWICGGADLAPVTESRMDLSSTFADPDLVCTLRDYDGHRFALNRCGGCGFMQPEALASRPGYFDALYRLKWSDEWMEQDFVSGYKDVIFRTILAELEKRVRTPPPRSLLDVGAHVGRMIDLAHQAGWRSEGIELNPKTAAFATARTKLPVHRMNAKELVATGVRYNAVVLTDVLEHIPDPVPVLAQLRELLTAGGWISVKVPHGMSQLRKQRLRHAVSKSQDPGIGTNQVHINHFGPHSLALALRQVGFDSIHVGVGAPEFPPGGGLGGRLSRGFRLAVYNAARLIPFGTRTPLTMNLQAYARNPA